MVVNLDIPETAKGWTGVVVLFVLIWLFLQTATISAFILGALIILAVAYVLMIVGVRIHKKMRDGTLRSRNSGSE